MKKNITFSFIFYIISTLFLLVYLIADLSSFLMLSEFGRLFLLCGSCVLLYLGGLFLSKYRKDNKPMKINLWIFFILYCILLITLTLFDPMWGRNGFNVFNWTKEEFEYYVLGSVNLIPFKTITGYIKDIFTSLLSTSNIFFNLFGNVVCLMPLALFIPILFKKVNNTKRFLISIICVTFGIEIVQFITFTGSCDIDDVILNTLGAFIMYKILNIKDIKNLINNIFLLEKNKINKKKILQVLIPLFIVVVLCFGLYKIGERYYDNNLDDWMSKRNYKLEIIDETKNCDTTLEKFYETELYEYYFSCQKSDYVYVRINGGEKYLIKELLYNNPTDYIISIDRFERAGLEFIKQEKYTKIELNLKGNVNFDRAKIDDETILEIGFGISEQGITEMMQEVFLIPKKEGKTILSFDVYDSNTSQVVKTIKYKVNIDNDLKVTYEEIK